jgi:hypothetical protein
MPESPGKSRVDKLDEAFLFLISLTSVIFMIIQAFSGGITFVIYSMPLLVVGVVIPFYYGYWRGALEDSAIMRARGWAFLLSGIFGYIAAVILYNIMELGAVIWAGSLVLFLFLLLPFSYLFMSRILDRIFELCNKEISLLDVRIVTSTMIAGSLLAAFLCFQTILFYEILPHISIYSGSPVFLSLISCFFLFFPGILLELDSRKMLKNYGKPYHVVVPEFLKKHKFIEILNSLMLSLMLYSLLLSFLIEVISILLRWVELFLCIFVLLVLSEVLFSLLYLFNLFSRKIVFERDS